MQIFSTQTGITKPHKYSKNQDKSHLSGQNMEPLNSLRVKETLNYLCTCLRSRSKVLTVG